MQQIVAERVVLRGFPPYAVNGYLLGDARLDAGTWYAGPRLLRRALMCGYAAGLSTGPC